MEAHWRGAKIVLWTLPLVGLALGVCCSPLLRIRQVIVQAPDRSLGAEVASQLTLPARANMLFYPLHRVTRDARKSYRVGEVLVARTSPRVLTVQVEPRPPFAALDDGKGYTLVSREGILLFRAPDPPPDLPRLTGLTSPRAPLGTKVAEERWRWTLEILAGATKSGIRDGLRLDMSNLYQITVRTAEGVKANLGNVNDLTRKAAIVGRVVEQVRGGGQQIVNVDVSTPETPRWRTTPVPAPAPVVAPSPASTRGVPAGADEGTPTGT